MVIDTRLPVDAATENEILSTDGVVSIAEGVDNGQRVIVIGIRSRDAIGRLGLPGTLGGLPVRYEVQEQPSLGAWNQAEPPSPPLLPPGGPETNLPQAAAADFVARTRPVPPGVSIGHVDISAGTASFIATDGSSLYQLGNNHVLAKKDLADVGDPIVQPGSADGGDPDNDRVGSLAGFVPIGEEGESRVDIAWYSPEVDVSPDILRAGPPKATLFDPDIGDRLTFIGRSSGVAAAAVDRVGVSIEIQGGQRFRDCYRLDRRLIGGDSGSPVVFDSEEGLLPAGVGFASTGSNGYCMYASNIEADTGLAIVPVSAQVGGGGGINRSTLGLLGLGLALAYLGDD